LELGTHEVSWEIQSGAIERGGRDWVENFVKILPGLDLAKLWFERLLGTFKGSSCKYKKAQKNL
jgi:hypothetical protein